MKKFFALLVVLLICVTTLTFVACNDDKDEFSEYAKITLRSDMTLDEVKEALKEVEIFTMQTCGLDGTVAYEYTWARNGYSCVLPERYYGALFFEGNMYYGIFFEGDEEDIEVVDCTGYETIYSQNEKTDVEAYLDVLYELMGENEYTIKGNVVTVGVKDDSGAVVGQYIAKNFNATRLEIPAKYKDTYKTLKPTTTVLVFEDIDENTCMLSKINVPLKSLQIPEKNNGKTVTKIDISGHAEKLTIPKTVKNIFGLSEYNSITYLGTKEEWYSNVSTGCLQVQCDIVCTDGTINKGDTRPTA